MHEPFYANITAAWIIWNTYTNLYIGETTAHRPNNPARESKQYSIGEYASAIRMQIAGHAAPIWWKCPIRGPPFADKLKGFILHGGQNHHEINSLVSNRSIRYLKFSGFHEIRSIISRGSACLNSDSFSRIVIMTSGAAIPPIIRGSVPRM